MTFHDHNITEVNDDYGGKINLGCKTEQCEPTMKYENENNKTKIS